MAQQYGEQAFNTFIGGLVTEAGELTFPPNASIDELNCDLQRDGSRRRRLGIAVEAGGSLSSETDVAGNAIVSVNRWDNVSEQAGVEFIVVQAGQFVWFYQVTTSANISDSRVPTSFTNSAEYFINLNNYQRPASVNGASSEPINCSSLKGGLVIASPEINTLLVERDVSTGAFTITQIDFYYRDYQWQGDTEAYASEGSQTNARFYDSLNAGWTTATLSSYSGSSYPPLTLPWYSGKDSNGFFSRTEWQKIWAGNSLITNGHYILNLYFGNRTSASGISGIPSSIEDARFSTVAGYQGRMFYSGMSNSTADNGSKVFFSAIMSQGFNNIGRCHQANDPTAETISDLLDNDGGYITIPEAHNIKRLHVFGTKVLVFADNGVWSIGGVDDVFRATDYSVTKVSEEGLVNRGSFVSAGGRPYWWSAGGIYTVVLDSLNNIRSENISIGKVQSFWEDIGPDGRDKVQGAYDEVNRRVVWCYQTDNSFDSKLNGILVFDEPLDAFFPWLVSDSDTNTDWIVGLTQLSGNASASVTNNVLDAALDTVVDAAIDDVVTTAEGRELSSTRLFFFVRDGTTGAYTFAEFDSTSFDDWGDADYTSYAESAYNYFGSLEQRKNIPYVTSYMRTTETGWTLNGSQYDLDRESSCLFSCYWDFKKVPGAVKQQMYRLKQTPVVDTADLSDNQLPTTVIVSRVRPRGRGRVARFRWESEAGKDFHILGWNTVGAINGRF